jgi:hypothetical protein
MTALTLTAFAAALVPVSGYILDIAWKDGLPLDVAFSETTPEAPLWSLFDLLDAWGIGYYFIVETTHDA